MLRRAKRKAKQAGGSAAKEEFVTRKNAKGSTLLNACLTCGEEFDSRSKLFAHIKRTKHGVLKDMLYNEDDNGTRKGKRKRRNRR